MRLERIGITLLIVITLLVVVVVGVSALMRLAADDLFILLDEPRGATSARTQPGMWLSSQLSPDVDMHDLVAVRARADQLGVRSDRVRELVGVAALAGLVVAVFSGQVEAGARRVREASIPAANRDSNGTV